MTDLLTTPIVLAIIAISGPIIAAIGTIANTRIGHLQLRRTPKLSEPTILPSCTTILGADMSRNVRDLPSYSQGMKHMGLNRDIR